MLLNLKLEANRSQIQCAELLLTERLPDTIVAPCRVEVRYVIQESDAYYLIKLEVTSELTIICQRCLDPFTYRYTNDTVLAAYGTETAAEKHNDDCDSIIAPYDELDLAALITDELYLYSPTIHPNIADCNTEIAKFIHSSV